MTSYKQASSKQEKERSDITQSPQALLRQISKQAAEHTKRGKQLLSKSKMESEWRSLRKRAKYESFSYVGEIRVWLRADFQSGSRVLKKVF